MNGQQPPERRRFRATSRATTRAAAVAQKIEPLIARELVGINSLDAAIARQTAPDYGYLYQELRSEKLASLAQLIAVLRMHGLPVQSDPRALEMLMKAQTWASQALSTPLTLRALRNAEAELVNACAKAVNGARGPELGAIRKVLGRAIVGTTVLSAHLAKMSGESRDSGVVPRALSAYFAGEDARVCMRCLLDRPGREPALERRDPHPFTYICSACHDEVYGEFPVDLLPQLQQAERTVREALIIHKALSRPSRLSAIRLVLHPLSGIEAEIPIPAPERALDVPAASSVEGPVEPRAVRSEMPVPGGSDLEIDYVARLFDYRSVRQHW
jgi:hypothetical protein